MAMLLWANSGVSIIATATVRGFVRVRVRVRVSVSGLGIGLGFRNWV